MRRAAVVIGSLLVTAVFAASAAGEHNQLELVSTGPVGGNGAFDASYRGASADATRVFFDTSEKLVGSDTDAQFDVYERSGGQTTLISAGGAGASGAGFVGASADGARVFFATQQSLAGADTDAVQDVYERSGGQTTLVSTGPDGGNGDFNAQLAAVSADGTHVFFATEESLVSADTDGRFDIYERSGGQTTLVSTGPDGGNGATFPTTFVRVSADGERAFMLLAESLVAADIDGRSDIYERSGGQTTLISTGPDGGDGAFDAGVPHVSADGTRVLFETAESLVAGDIDTQVDVYERSAGQTTLVSAGDGDFGASFQGMSSDAARVFFATVESLVSADTDTGADVYERAGGQTTLVSGGDGDLEAEFEGASADGARVFFVTEESLVSADTDAQADVYERAGGQTTLISTGPSGGNGALEATFDGVSADGARVLFETAEALTGADTDTAVDVYEKRIVAPPRNTAPPVISGIAAVGRTLACSRGTWTNGPTSFAYRWNRDGGAIAGAIASAYTVTGADAGHRITCTVTAANAGGTGSASSAAVTPIAAAGPGPGPGPLPGACANARTGSAAAERLTGSAFGDRLRGLAGNDVLIGLAGDDCLSGGRGRDRLRGGGGRDKLNGGAGRDKVNGGAGNDTINSRDRRRDAVRCGAGRRDRVTADRIDRLVGCEKVRRR